MYGRWDTNEYMTRLNEFLECAGENQRVTGERHLPYPYWKCQNVLTTHCQSFQLGYIRWVRHREPKEYVGNVTSRIDVHKELGVENNVDSGIDVREELGCKNIKIDVREELGCKNIKIDVQNLDDGQDCINDNLDEMIHDVQPEFADIPKIFETLGKEMNIPYIPVQNLQ
jgi:hypothetical protein